MAQAKSPARRLIVHLGVQKTGSTAIQHYLQKNEAALKPAIVIRTPREGTPMRPLGRAAVQFALSPDEENKALFCVALDEVLAGLPQNDLPVLISHENLAGAMPGNGGETRLFPVLPDIAKMIRQRARGFQTDFVIYTRNMNAWKSSVWAQAVRSDGYTRSHDEFLDEVAVLPGWGNLMQRMVAAVGDKHVIRFNLKDETDRNHPARRLLLHAGLDAALIDRLEPVGGGSMQRLRPSATEFIRHINTLNINPYARGKVSDLVARNQTLFAADWSRDSSS